MKNHINKGFYNYFWIILSYNTLNIHVFKQKAEKIILGVTNNNKKKGGVC